MYRQTLAGALLLSLGCSAASEPGPRCARELGYSHADVVVEAPGSVATPAAVNEPENAIDDAVVGDPHGGSLEVLSRGYSTKPPNNYVILSWSGRWVEDVDGPDLVVFENAFFTGERVFMDHAVVSASADGEKFYEFPHDYLAEDESRYSADPADWVGFAGTSPVSFDSRATPCQDPFGPGLGGDFFDLDDLPNEVVEAGVRFVKLVAAPTLVNPDTGSPYPRSGASDGFDLDGIVARSMAAD